MKKLLVVISVFLLNSASFVSRKSLVVLVSFLLSAQLFAATPLKKGETAPFSGILITKAEEAKVAKLKAENELMKKLAFKRKELIFNQQKRIDILEKKLQKRDVSGFVAGLYFFGGVLLTGTSVYLAGKLVRR